MSGLPPPSLVCTDTISPVLPTNRSGSKALSVPVTTHRLKKFSVHIVNIYWEMLSQVGILVILKMKKRKCGEFEQLTQGHSGRK